MRRLLGEEGLIESAEHLLQTGGRPVDRSYRRCPRLSPAGGPNRDQGCIPAREDPPRHTVPRHASFYRPRRGVFSATRNQSTGRFPPKSARSAHRSQTRTLCKITSVISKTRHNGKSASSASDRFGESIVYRPGKQDRFFLPPDAKNAGGQIGERWLK